MSNYSLITKWYFDQNKLFISQIFKSCETKWPHASSHYRYSYIISSHSSLENLLCSPLRISQIFESSKYFSFLYVTLSTESEWQFLHIRKHLQCQHLKHNHWHQWLIWCRPCSQHTARYTVGCVPYQNVWCGHLNNLIHLR